MSPESAPQPNCEPAGAKPGPAETGVGETAHRRVNLSSALPSPHGRSRAAWIPIFLAVALGFVYVWLFGVNVISGDEWDRLFLFEHQAAGTLTFSDLWSLHNEHRTFFPELTVLGLGLATKYNTIVEMYCSVLLLAAVLAMYIYVYVKDFPGRSALWLLAPAAFLTMSWKQAETLLLGLLIVFVMVQAASIAVFFCLRLVRDRNWLAPLAGALALAVVASFSCAQGLLAWPAGLVQIFLLAINRRLKIALSLAWMVIGCGVWLTYFHGYVKPAHHPGFIFSPAYLLASVGGALVGGSGSHSRMPVLAALVLGAEILLLAALAVALVIRRRQWHRYSFWLATMVYSLLTILSITIGRSGLGVHQALSSRYSTFAISLVAATYVILISLAREHPASRLWRFQGVLIGLLLLVVGLGDVAGYLSGSRGREVRQYLAFVVSTIEDQPDEVYNPGYLDSLRSKAAFLKRQGDNVFAKGGIAEKYAPLSDTLPRLSDPTQFKIDGFQEIDDHKAYSVTGWAVDSVHGDLAGGVYLVLDGKEYPLYYGAPRPEVATRLQNEGLLHCGFQRLLPAKVVAPGRHEVSLKVLTNDRQALLNTGGGMAMDIK